uniref:Uncharacterized protein n=1 Tax=Knipowitschia caucasica TaxID=637954 RepID=A0AAV2MI45_KNICA
MNVYWAVVKQFVVPREREQSCETGTGQKSDDPLSPDYVPSVFAHTKSPAKRPAVQSLEKFNVRQNLKKKKLLQSSRSEAAMALLDFSSEMSEMTTQLTENEMPEGECAKLT